MPRRGRAPSEDRWNAPSGQAAAVPPATAMTRAGLALYTWDLASDEIVWSPNASEVLGIAADLVGTGDALAAIVEPGSGAAPLESLHAVDRPDEGSGVGYRARYALRTRPDHLLMVEDVGRWYADAQGRPALLRGALRAEPQSGSDDGLSGNLKARTALLRQIFDDVREAQRSRRAVTLVVGHLAGDADSHVAWVAERIRPLLRRGDRFVPYAPDRFALALRSCPAAEAGQALRRLSALIGDSRVRLGSASAPDHALDAPRLLRRAEEALAGAEAGFRFDGSSGAEKLPRGSGTTPAEILDALNERRLVAGYRTAQDARSRKPVLATLVPHMERPDGPVPVGDLGQAAEKAGLSTLVDMRLLELAATRLASRPEDRIVLGVSPSTLRDGEWLHGLAAHLGARPGIQTRLIVAVHEATLCETGARGRLDAMKALGVGIMLAGFGSGHASVRELRSLPADILRIDAAIVQTLTRSLDDRLFVRGLVDLAQHCGIPTLAEAVEEDASASLLAQWGADYLERPLPGGAAPAEQPVRRPRSQAA